jgi:hypothetical protein
MCVAARRMVRSTPRRPGLLSLDRGIRRRETPVLGEFALIESLESQGEPLRVRTEGSARGDMQLLPVEVLQELEHRPVLFVEKRPRNAHLVVRRYTDQLLIERTMMNRTEAQAICHSRGSRVLEVADDVSGIQKADFMQSAHRALIRISGQDQTSEAGLV